MYANIKPLLLGKKKQRFFAILASPEGEAVGGPARRLMRGKLIVIAHERVAEANSPLIRPCGATFSLRAKSRLRRLRSDTRLRAQPLGGSQRRKFLKIPPRLQYRSRGIRFSIQKVKARGGVGTDK